MADEPNKIEVEVVAEVRAVDREVVDVVYHDDQRLISLYGDRYGDLQTISFPADKARAVCDAILQLAEQKRNG
jgi:hypothetical protein